MAAVTVSISGRKAIGGATKYVVCVFDGKTSWNVVRGYAEFIELHEFVTGSAPSLPAIRGKPFPAKSATQFASYAVQMALMSMLQKIVAQEEFVAMEYVRAFLGMPITEKVQHTEDVADGAAMSFAWGVGDVVKTEVVRQDPATGKIVIVETVRDGLSTATGSFESVEAATSD